MKHTAEQNEKVSRAMKTVVRTPEWCAKIGESNRRRGTLPPESLKKMSDSVKDAWTRIPHPRLGKTFTEESKLKMSVSQKAASANEETHRKRSESQKIRSAREDEKTTRSNRLKEMWEDPSYKEKFLNGRSNYVISEETRNKMSDGQKRRREREREMATD